MKLLFEGPLASPSEILEPLPRAERASPLGSETDVRRSRRTVIMALLLSACTASVTSIVVSGDATNMHVQK